MKTLIIQVLLSHLDCQRSLGLVAVIALFSFITPCSVWAQGDDLHINEVDAAEMVWIPAGAFVMGNDEGAKEEQPSRTVTLNDGYWIYKHEVTVGQYLTFAEETGREVKTEPPYGFVKDYPMTYVDWDDAAAYCTWAGAQLPIEAQWEKAARGPESRMWPWGNTYDKAKAHVGPGVKPEPKAVGSYPAGASAFGVLDMTGNVAEWVNDYYASDYYKTAPDTDPLGPDRGQHAVRGGSFRDGNQKKLTTTARSGVSTSTRSGTVGFRCVVIES